MTGPAATKPPAVMGRSLVALLSAASGEGFRDPVFVRTSGPEALP